MKNMNRIKRVKGWKTSKTDRGFEGVAFSHGDNGDRVIHYVTIQPTRARAASRAKKALLYLKHVS